MEFSEYLFDVTRLWETNTSRVDDEKVPQLTKRTGPTRAFAAEVVQFPGPTKIIAEEAVLADAAGCRKRTRAELRSIAMSLKLRDMLRRNAIAYRCANCARCPDMSG